MAETVTDPLMQEALREPIRRLAHHMQNSD